MVKRVKSFVPPSSCRLFGVLITSGKSHDPLHSNNQASSHSKQPSALQMLLSHTLSYFLVIVVLWARSAFKWTTFHQHSLHFTNNWNWNWNVSLSYTYRGARNKMHNINQPVDTHFHSKLLDHVDIKTSSLDTEIRVQATTYVSFINDFITDQLRSS